MYANQQLVHQDTFDGPVELGRQHAEEGGPYERRRGDEVWRLVIARLDEGSVSRRHARVELLPDGKIRLKNCSSRCPIGLQDGGSLAPGEECLVSGPVLMTLGERLVRVQPCI